jgi:hypothetical protein
MIDKNYFPHSIWEAKTVKRGRDWGQDTPCKANTSALLPPIRTHLLIVHSAPNSSMDQSIDEVSVLMLQSSLNPAPGPSLQSLGGHLTLKP